MYILWRYKIVFLFQIFTRCLLVWNNRRSIQYMVQYMMTKSNSLNKYWFVKKNGLGHVSVYWNSLILTNRVHFETIHWNDAGVSNDEGVNCDHHVMTGLIHFVWFITMLLFKIIGADKNIMEQCYKNIKMIDCILYLLLVLIDMAGLVNL